MSRVRKVTYVEDAEDDSGSSIEGIRGTRKYAVSEPRRSPSRERSNTGKLRGHSRHMPDSDDESISGNSLVDSDSTARSPVRERSRSRVRERSRSRGPGRAVRETREPSQREYDREQRNHESQRRETRRRQEEEEQRRRMRPETGERRERVPRDRDPRERGPRERDPRERDPRERDPRDRDPRDREPRHSKKPRPPAPKRAETQPAVQQNGYRRGHLDDPAAYGVQQPVMPGPGPRNRAQTRPASAYTGPMGNMNWPGPPLQPPFMVGSFPAPPHMFPEPGPGQMAPHMLPPVAPPMGPPGYFEGGFMAPPPPPPPHPTGEPLRTRFDRRPSSSMGFQSPMATTYSPDQYNFEEEPHPPPANRRSSRSKRVDDGRQKKKPPPDLLPKRTQSAKLMGAPFAPPAQHDYPPSRQSHRPPAPHQRSVGFADQYPPTYDDADFHGDADLYNEVSPDQRRTALARVRRNSTVYEQGGMDMVPAMGRGRRSSIYGIGGLEGGGASLGEDKYFDALKYQEDVSGGSGMPLTAESLRKASKRGQASSSRSTRSNSSHDESEYRHSNTTGITRSSSGGNKNKEDLTIKVSKAAIVRVSGAEIECNDGGEITVSSKRAQGQSGTSRVGSDKESTVYQPDDARSSRMERKALPYRPRAMSQSDTRSRADLRSLIDTQSRANLRSRVDTHSRADLRSRADTHSRADLRSRADNHSRYAPSQYDSDPYEQMTYDHAPYDPALAASNFY